MPTMPTTQQQTHTRDFGTDLALTDEGYAEGIVVPYNEVAHIVERNAAGEVVEYDEMFLAGAFDRAIRVPDRVTLTYTHDENLGNRLGFGVSFEDRPEGLWGRFKLDRSRIDIAHDVLSTSHKGFSVSFLSIVPRMGLERSGDLVQRRSVHLRHVAAVTTPAYASAGVLALREDGSPDGEPTEAERQAAAERQAEAQAQADLAKRRAEVLAESEALLSRHAEWADKVGDY